MSTRPVCCACSSPSTELAFQGDGFELVRGLTYIGRGKWLCVSCTKAANVGFARDVSSHFAKRDNAPPLPVDEPPPGFA